ncbi:hypothetical protein IVB34_12630 [Bradyrhizobium sp. 2]|uniref:hypothetical protein n=1 Tax=Bradyrhizobium sp. 2 TaxID=190045 RepID=UPI001FF99122|nr:hypothetical protein [Bradyrhizobium sp. 2]MCK1459135.1 hypothetical protein [Bradyrhizobium sp. 2]MCK1459201.1 hypothetical protein [Bradyrhizobium sp. 2]
MDQRRRHYFPDNDCHVITGLCPNGEFGAYRESEDEGRVRGYGHTRLAAIADLVESLDLDEEAFDHEAARADHIVSLRREAV